MDKLMEITIGNLLNNAAEQYKDNKFVAYCDIPFRTTYFEFLEKVNQIAKGFIRLGIKKGDHISIWATNYPEWLLTMFSIAKIGAVLVTINTNYKALELEYILKQSNSHTLVMISGTNDLNYNSIVKEIIPELKGKRPGEWKSKRLPVLKNIININNENIDGTLNWDQLYKLAEDISDAKLHQYERNVDPHDVVSILYTSGTTGFPKGAMLSHYSIINNAFYVGECMKFTEKDILCVTVQFFHCFGIVCSVLACITHGSCMVPIEHFNPKTVIETVIMEKCTVLYGVPTMFISILSQPDIKRSDFSSLRTGIMAGALCPVNLMRQVIKELNIKEITIAYGQTEAGPVCTQTTTEDPLEMRISTVGRALPFTECKIIDTETGRECPPNVPGEFTVNGFAVMKGYYNMPEATAHTIKNGWLYTGDLAVCDEKGYYKITGRIRDMIIKGGENIYPKEIEDFLYTHPRISEIQVVGVPSKKYGEEVFAYIMPSKGETVDGEELKQYADKSIAKYKIPSYFRTIEQFPMTASGKIQKYKLREMAAQELGLE